MPDFSISPFLGDLAGNSHVGRASVPTMDSATCADAGGGLAGAGCGGGLEDSRTLSQMKVSGGDHHLRAAGLKRPGW